MREHVLAVRTLVIELDPAVGSGFTTHPRRIFGGAENQERSADGVGNRNPSAVGFLETHISSRFTEYGGKALRLVSRNPGRGPDPPPRPDTPKELPPEVAPAIFAPFLASVRQLFPRLRSFYLADESDPLLKALVRAELGDGQGGTALKINFVGGGGGFTRLRCMLMHVDDRYDSD